MMSNGRRSDISSCDNDRLVKNNEYGKSQRQNNTYVKDALYRTHLKAAEFGIHKKNPEADM